MASDSVALDFLDFLLADFDLEADASAKDSDSGGLGNPATASCSLSSKSSNSSSLTKLSLSRERTSVRCLLFPKKTALSVGAKFRRPFVKSSSESKSEKSSNDDRPCVRVGPLRKSKVFTSVAD